MSCRGGGKGRVEERIEAVLAAVTVEAKTVMIEVNLTVMVATPVVVAARIVMIEVNLSMMMAAPPVVVVDSGAQGGRERAEE